MKLKSSLLTISLLYSQLSLACEKPVTYLIKDSIVPCNGFLFTETKEKEIRILVEETKLKDTKIDLQQRKIDLLLENEKYWQEIAQKEAEKGELWRVRAIDSTEKLTASERNQGLRDWLFLTGGVLITIGAGVALGQINK